MPRVCEFYGIQIYIYYDDHDSPHFHAVYAGREVQVRIDDLSIIAGRIPPRAMGLVIEWAAQRRTALREDWQLAREHMALKPITPLK